MPGTRIGERRTFTCDMRAIGIALIALAVLALMAKIGVAHAQDGYNPRAATLLSDVLAKHQFVPNAKASFYSNVPWQFTVPEGTREDVRRIEARSTELLGKLKNGGYRFVAPIEQADRITDLRSYISLKPACAAQPLRFWNISSDTPVSQQDLERYAGGNFPRVIVPYAPNLPRPVDYEIAYIEGQMIVAPATEGFALYQPPRSAADPGPNMMYVLRAEEFFVPDQAGAPVDPNRAGWGIFAAFQYPSCIFRGTVDYFDSCGGLDGGRLRDRYIAEIIIAEIIEIDDTYFALTVTTASCPESIVGSHYVITLWDLGVSTDTSGTKYTLVQRR